MGSAAGVEAAFADQQSLQTAFLEVTPRLSKLSQDQRQLLQRELEGLAFFEMLDVRKDGKISMPEAKKAFIQLHPALNKCINKAFVDADESGDFYLNKSELMSLRTSLAEYAKFDTSGDGRVSMPEAKKSLGSVYPKLATQINKAFVDADDSGDFYLDMREFASLHAALGEYQMIDTSGDGKVSMPEAKKTLVKVYPQLDKSINKAFIDSDASGDFYLDMREFASLHGALGAFAKIDKSGDGKLSMPEAKKALVKLYPQLKRSINKAFVDSDASGDFYLDMREFASLHAALGAFAKIDTSGDGKVSLPEAKKILVKLYPHLDKLINKAFIDSDESGDFYLDMRELASLHAALGAFAKIDTSGDGKVSIPEAKKALVKLYPQLDKSINKAFIDSDETGNFYLDMREFASLQAALASFARIDTSGDGKVSMPEGKKALVRSYPELAMHINKAFVDADESGDFYLDMREFAAVRAALGAFAKIDRSGDGKVSMPEAKTALMKTFPELNKQINTAFVNADESGDFYLDMREFAYLHDALAMYATVDTNGDGKLSMPEGKKALVKSYPGMKDDINKAFVAADKSKDFYLSMAEFAYLSRMLSGFKRVDKSGDGKISLPEAKKHIGKLFPNANMTAVFMEIDKTATTGDFYLTVEEYMALHKKLAA